MTDPTDPIPVPSRAEAELAALDVRRAELLAQVEAERQARESAAPQLRELAIHIHRALCMERHNGTGACGWATDVHADDAEAANWVEPAHLRWLGVAWASVEVARGAGWTVEPPPLPEPTP